MRLIRDAAAGVIADGSGIEPCPEPRRQVSRGPVVARDDDGRLVRIAVEQGGDQVRTQRLRDECAAAVACQRGGLLVVVCMGEKGAEHPPLRIGRRRPLP